MRFVFSSSVRRKTIYPMKATVMDLSGEMRRSQSFFRDAKVHFFKQMENGIKIYYVFLRFSIIKWNKLKTVC